MGFSRQEYWSRLPFPTPRDIPTQSLNPGLLHCRQILYHWASRDTFWLKKSLLVIKPVTQVCFIPSILSIHWKDDSEAEVSILWPPDAKSWLIGKDPDAVEDWRQEKGVTEDEMVGWHHWLNGHEFEQALRHGEGQGRLACCSPWGRKRSDTAERLNNNKSKKCKCDMSF